jgi:hypothetical protein
VAGLIRTVVLAPLVLLVLLLAAPLAIGAEPPATPHAPTCAERFPDPGPAGVDLRLGCIVSEVVGLWRPGQASQPPTLSAYAIAIGILVAALVGLGLVATRLVARRAGTRLAATTPDAWWICPACHSINGLNATRCYNCSAPRPADAFADAMPTSHDPSTPQSFGRGKRG